MQLYDVSYIKSSVAETFLIISCVTVVYFVWLLQSSYEYQRSSGNEKTGYPAETAGSPFIE